MTVVYIVACSVCRYIARFPDGEAGRCRARAAAMNHAENVSHPVACYAAELVEFVEPAGRGTAYGIEVARRAV